VISGPGTLAKTGSGRITLNAANTFTGPTYINEGTVVARHNTAFGTTAAGTFIADGATLDIGGGLNVDTLNLGAELFTVSGSGVDGQGAIVNNHANRQLNAFGRLVLAGDTTVGAVGRWISGRTPVRDPQRPHPHQDRSSEFCLVAAQVYGSGHLVTTQAFSGSKAPRV
jgi:autotransporter-associated beta strand protein